MTHRKVDVLVVGGGIIGVSTAYFAALKGADVLILEKSEIGSGSSGGNAGLIVPSYFEPLPGPGMVKEGVSGIFNVDGFFGLRPRLDPAFFWWLMRFITFCTNRHCESGIRIITALNEEALRIHLEFAERGGTEYDFKRSGLLFLFLEKRRLAEAENRAAKASKYGIKAEVLVGDQIQAVEPLAGENVTGGVRYLSDLRLNPALFLRWLSQRATMLGAEIISQCEVYGFRTSAEGSVKQVLTTKGEFRADQIVLATGAWLRPLGKCLGVSVPVEGGKGISQTFYSPKVNLAQPLILGEHHIAVSSLTGAMRVTGLLELTGTDLTLDRRRVEGIHRAATRYVPALGEMQPGEVWRGLRPCTPDGLPLIGRLRHHNNVIIAGGHDTKGMTLGPLTGSFVAQLLSGQELPMFGKELSPRRFSV